jgi:hypothetical protein
MNYATFKGVPASQMCVASHTGAIIASFDKYADIININTSQSSNTGE